MFFQWNIKDGCYFGDKPKMLSEDDYFDLNPKEDVATSILGRNWRTPTVEEFEELFSKTYNEVVTINSRKCWELTSKTDKTKSIIIPISGIFNYKDNKWHGENEWAYLWIHDKELTHRFEGIVELEPKEITLSVADNKPSIHEIRAVYQQ